MTKTANTHDNGRMFGFDGVNMWIEQTMTEEGIMAPRKTHITWDQKAARGSGADNSTFCGKYVSSRLIDRSHPTCRECALRVALDNYRKAIETEEA